MNRYDETGPVLLTGDGPDEGRSRMTIEKESVYPYCEKAECFARSKDMGGCQVLTSTDFKGRTCPFYKTRDQFKLDREQADRRLLRIGYKGEAK